MKKYLPEILVVLVSALVIFGVNTVRPSSIAPIPLVDKLEPAPVKLVWGFPADSISIDTFKVKRNQSLSDILGSKGFSSANVYQLDKNSKDVFDVRRIKSGNPYYILNTDTLGNPDFMVYQESAIDYVIFELADSFSVSRGQKQMDTITTTVAAVIESSMWNALVAVGASPVLAVDLSDIFAWTVDFFGIQKGDNFKAIYDELYVEGEYVGLGKIYAALFEHMGEPIYAIWYNGNQQEGYFDSEGKSLKKAFLKAPLNYSRISSRFSLNRLHPVLKIRRPHRGVDYSAPSGTPVYSIGDGAIVKKAYQAAGGGNYLTIKHNSVYSSQYMHLQGYAKGITTGVRVKQGQLIGYVGRTGLATGPHLDFRIIKNGQLVDPLKVKAPPVEPISEENMPAFIQVRDSLSSELDAILFNVQATVASKE